MSDEELKLLEDMSRELAKITEQMMRLGRLMQESVDLVRQIATKDG